MLFPYECSAGKTTIGWGRNLEDNGISPAEAEFMLDNDLAVALRQVSNVFPNFKSYSKNRQNALTDMIFNLGRSRFIGFKKMILAVCNEDWTEAARQAKDSKWHTQVGTRAIEIEKMLEEG